jgi:hypothetical protein
MRPTKEDMLAYLAEAQRIQTALFGKVQMSIHCYTYGEHITIDIVISHLAWDTQRMWAFRSFIDKEMNDKYLYSLTTYANDLHTL